MSSLTLSEIHDAAKKRVARISEEFVEGFAFIENYPKSVTFFGSARTKPDNYYYKKTKHLAGRIVNELHYAVLSGGGGGIMDASNEGAFEAGGNSVGLNIKLPNEQAPNPHLTDFMNFHYFFIRKVCLAFSAEAYIFCPGGFGTIDEFSEILTLIQTKKIPSAPMILYGEKFWTPLLDYFAGPMLDEKYISPEDMYLFSCTDDEDKIIEIIKMAPVRFGLEFHADRNTTRHPDEGAIVDLSKK